MSELVGQSVSQSVENLTKFLKFRSNFELVHGYAKPTLPRCYSNNI